MHYQTFSNLQFRPLLTNFLSDFQIDSRETRDEKYFLTFLLSLVLFWCLEKAPTFNSNLKEAAKWLLQNN